MRARRRFPPAQVLATAVHRATKLDQRSNESETVAWVRYLTQHYPGGRNGHDEVKLLWVDWRTSLLKESTARPRIAITHGHSAIHWERDNLGRLCLNLEDSWGRLRREPPHITTASPHPAPLR
jgi:hypothetical protein